MTASVKLLFNQKYFAWSLKCVYKVFVHKNASVPIPESPIVVALGFFLPAGIAVKPEELLAEGL